MKIQHDQTCVIIVDFQNDSCGVGLGNQEKYQPIIEAVNKTNKLMDVLRKKGVACIFTKHIEEPNSLPDNLQLLYDNKENLSNGHYTKGQSGSELYGNLILPYDLVFEKTLWGAFSNKDLESYLISKDIKNLIICGAETETCVLSTITEAFDRGYNIFMPINCIATKANKIDSHHIPMMEIFNRYYGYVIDESDLLNML